MKPRTLLHKNMEMDSKREFKTILTLYSYKILILQQKLIRKTILTNKIFLIGKEINIDVEFEYGKVLAIKAALLT